MKLSAPVKDLVLELDPKGDVTQWFGVNKALYAYMGLNGHNGIDIVRQWGEPLYAIEDGEVIDAKTDPGGFGKHLRLISSKPNKNGLYNEWTYGHCASVSVKIGDKVKAGQQIALMGNTGFVVSNVPPHWETNPYAGTHLHLGLRELKRPVRGGWAYPGSKVAIEVVNYGNGFKGAIDPVPVLVALSVPPKELPPVSKEEKLNGLQVQVIAALTALLKLLKK